MGKILAISLTRFMQISQQNMKIPVGECSKASAQKKEREIIYKLMKKSSTTLVIKEIKI